MGKLTNWMAIFNSYVKLPEGTPRKKLPKMLVGMNLTKHRKMVDGL